MMKTQKRIKLYVFTQHLHRQAGCDARSVLHLCTTSFNLEFSFSTSCHNKFKKPSSPYYLPIAGVGIVEFLPFFKAVSSICNSNSVIQNLNSGCQVHFFGQ